MKVSPSGHRVQTHPGAGADPVLDSGPAGFSSQPSYSPQGGGGSNHAQYHNPAGYGRGDGTGYKYR